MTRRPVVAAAFAVGVLVLAACGGGGHDGHSASSDSASRTVNVEMIDIAYHPSTIDVKGGETMKFVFTNNGKVEHDAFLGDEVAQQQHEHDMRSGEAMHHEMNAVDVEPGKTGELTHTFKAGEHLVIGCHEEGHYAAGMKTTINVQ
jgi:uncharacterized cupredoxin-like copper-binding protein